MKKNLNGIVKAQREKALASFDLSEIAIAPSRDPKAAPLLPVDAMPTAEENELAASKGSWLQAYINFASESSPMTPTAFHLAQGLTVASIAIARRCHVRMGTAKIYPNLYTMFVGPSGQKKTSGLTVGTGLMDAAGMVPTFLLTPRMTPEALIGDLGTNIPQYYGGMSKTSQREWLRRRGLAGQRGWLIDEASGLFASLTRDYNAGLKEMILELYDAKDRTAGRLTKTHGEESIDNAYVTLFGATTYRALSLHLAKGEHWATGLFARFAMVASNDPIAWAYWPEPKKYPPELVTALAHLAHKSFGGVPVAQIKMEKTVIEKSNGEEIEIETQVVKLDRPLPDNPVILADGVKALFERYAKATMFTMLQYPETGMVIHPDLQPNYERFGTMHVKVSIILAALDHASMKRGPDTPVTIETYHAIQAQYIVESWRKSLHMIHAGLSGTESRGMADRIIERLASNGDQWTSQRDLYKGLHVAKKDIEDPIDHLLSTREIEIWSRPNQRGGPTIYYRILTE